MIPPMLPPFIPFVLPIVKDPSPAYVKGMAILAICQGVFLIGFIAFIIWDQCKK